MDRQSAVYQQVAGISGGIRLDWIAVALAAVGVEGYGHRGRGLGEEHGAHCIGQALPKVVTQLVTQNS